MSFCRTETSPLIARSSGPPPVRACALLDGRRDSRIDILFKPVDAVKTRMDYDGLILRCATTGERERILAETGCTADHRPVFIIESGKSLDYVVAMAVGWLEDEKEDREPSALASFAGATDPTRLLP